MDSATNLEELQTEMSLFWGSHAPQPLREDTAATGELQPRVPGPPPPLLPPSSGGGVGGGGPSPYLPPYLPLQPHYPCADMDRASVRRTRVCKRCKFSTSDASVFLQHQINAHSEAVEMHHCEKCEFVTAVYTELVSHRRLHRRSSSLSAAAATAAAAAAARQPSTDSESGIIDDANNNEKPDGGAGPPAGGAQEEQHAPPSPTSSSSSRPCAPPTAAAVANSCTPSPNKDHISTRNYTCQACGFKCTSSKTHLRHLVEEHHADFEIHECDLCDYATRYKHKLPRHRECHFGGATPKVGTSPTESFGDSPDEYPGPPLSDNGQLSIVSPKKEASNNLEIAMEEDENRNQMCGEKTRILPPASIKEENNQFESGLSQALAKGTSDNRNTSGNDKGHMHLSGGQLLGNTNKIISSFMSTGGKGRSMVGLNGSPSQVAPVKPKAACTPVREAVDPAKYVTIREPDGVKYACSKCGNIYKWRKSLNKHWKEKHDGEIPDPRPNFTPLSIPRIKGNEPAVKGKFPGSMGLMGSFSSSLNSGMNTSSSAQRSRSVKGEAFRAPMLSRVLRRPPMLDTYRGMGGGDNLGSKRYMASLQFMGEHRASPPDNTNRPPHSHYHSEMSERDILGAATSSSSTSSSRPQGGGGGGGGGLKYEAARSSSQSPLSLSTLSSRDSRSGGAYNGADSEEDVLDLSKKGSIEAPPPGKHSPGFVLAPTPPQDEPLDFSKKSGPVIEIVPIHEECIKEEKYGLEDYGVYEAAGPLIAEQTGAISLQCPSCAYVGRNKQDYDNHMELHLRKRHYKCAECQQVFFTISELNEHFLDNHLEVLQTKAVLAGMGGGGAGKYSSSSSSSESTQLYKYLTMDSSKQLLSCVICGAIFQWQWTLAKHFEQDHPTLPNPYRKRPPPSTMMTAFANAGNEPNLKRARNLEHDGQCNQCGYTSKCEADMKRHQLKHSLARNYTCKLCEFNTKYKDDLLVHYKNSHPTASLDLDQLMAAEGGSDELMHFTPPGSNTEVDLTAQDTAIVIPQAPEDSCNQGDKPSEGADSNSPSGKARSKSLKPTRENNSAESLLPFKCSVCEYRARWPSEITQHMKNHSDEKPFLCPRCSYRSKWKWDVVKHLKRCGGGTVKDVIDTTKMKKHEHVKAMLAEVAPLQPQPQPSESSGQAPQNPMPAANRGVLSNGPPNVTVVPSMKLPTSSSVAAEPVKNEPADTPMDISYNAGSPEHPGDHTSNPLAYLESQILPSSSGGASSSTSSGGSKTGQQPQLGLVQGQQHYCLQCPFVGNSPAELKRHSRVHSDEKPFICKTCGYCSKWKCDLKKHLRTYNHTSAVPLTYGGHGRKPADWSEEEKTPKDKAKNTCGSAARSLGAGSCKSSDEQDDEEHSPGGGGGGGGKEVTGVYRCSRCPFVAYKRDVLENHTKMLHQSRSMGGSATATGTKLTCKKCNFEAPDLSTFLQHKLSHSQPAQESLSLQDKAGNEYISENTSTQPQVAQAPKHRRKASRQFRVVQNAATHNFDDSSEEGSGLDESSYLTSSYVSMVCPDLTMESEEDIGFEVNQAPSEPEDLSKNAQPQGHATYSHRSSFEKQQAFHHLSSSHSSSSSSCYSCEWCEWSTDRLNLLYRHAQLAHATELALQEKASFCGGGGSVKRQRCSASPTGSPASSDKGLKLSFAESLDLRPIGAVDGASSPTLVDNDEGYVNSSESEMGKESGANRWQFGYSRKPDTVSRRRRRLKTCEKCGYITDNMTTLQRHMAKHGGHGKFTCLKCDYSVDRQHILQYHVKLVHEGQDLSGNECMASPSEVLSPSEGMSPAPEENEEDKGGEKQEEGQRAEEELGDPYAGDTEEERVEKEEEEEEEECGVIDDNATEAEVQVVLPEGEQEEQEEEHTAAAANEGGQEEEEGEEEVVSEMVKVKGREMKLTHQGKKITYGCPKCPFETIYVTNASKHLLQHGLDKKYKCEYCDYSQDQLRHVIHHMKSLHRSGGGQVGAEQEDEEEDEEGEEGEEDLEEEPENAEKCTGQENEEGDNLNDSNHENENPNMNVENSSSESARSAKGGSGKAGSSSSSSTKKGGACQLNKFHCHKCSFSTVSRGQFLSHQTCHSSGYNGKNRCSVCGHKATTSRLLTRHVQLCHQ